jgi:hypothetical protein
MPAGRRRAGCGTVGRVEHGVVSVETETVGERVTMRVLPEPVASIAAGRVGGPTPHHRRGRRAARRGELRRPVR